MRRLTIALLATFLLSIGAGPAVAQSPAPSLDPEPVPQRVEVPEAGIAVTFPDDWAVEVRPLVRVEATVPTVLSAEAPGGDTCEVALPDDPTRSSLHDWAESFLSTFRDFGSAATSTALRLPAGDAIRIDLELPDTGSSSVVYLLTDGTNFYGLMCRAPDAPEDRWLSVAETIEFLPVEG